MGPRRLWQNRLTRWLFLMACMSGLLLCYLLLTFHADLPVVRWQYRCCVCPAVLSTRLYCTRTMVEMVGLHMCCQMFR